MSVELSKEVIEAMKNRPKVDLNWVKKSPKKRKATQQDPIKRARGRPALQSLYPNIVETAKSFIEENGFKAHRRRQEDTGTCGSTLKQIKLHLLHTIPGLKENRPDIGTGWWFIFLINFNKKNSYIVNSNTLSTLFMPSFWVFWTKRGGSDFNLVFSLPRNNTKQDNICMISWIYGTNVGHFESNQIYLWCPIK